MWRVDKRNKPLSTALLLLRRSATTTTTTTATTTITHTIAINMIAQSGNDELEII
jgi:hypothetical protein